MRKRVFLERKLRVIREIMGDTTIVRIGIRKSGKIDIISADNVGITSDEIEDIKTSKEPCDYIG